MSFGLGDFHVFFFKTEIKCRTVEAKKQITVPTSFFLHTYVADVKVLGLDLDLELFKHINLARQTQQNLTDS